MSCTLHAAPGCLHLRGRPSTHNPSGPNAGTSSVEQSTGNVLHKRDPYAQARTALEIVAHGLEALGATLEDVVSGNGALVAVNGLCKGCLRAAGSAASGTVTLSA